MGLSEDVNWLKTHIVLLAIVVALAFGGVYGVESLISNHDAKQAAQYQALAQQQAVQNAEFQKQTANQLLVLAQQNAQLEQQFSQIVTVLAQREATEKKLPQVNQNLSAAEAAKTLGGTVQGDNVVLDLPLARTLVTDVQLVPLLQQDKTDLEKQNGLLQTEVANGVQALNLEREAHASDNSANAATIKARDAEIVAIKAECRKSKLKWFGIGYVAGFLSAIGLHASGV